MNVYDADKEFCNDFESKITKEYDLFIKKIIDEVQSIENVKNDIEKILDNNKKLSQMSFYLLNSTNSLNKQWLKFYPEMSTTYKIRANLTEIEYTMLAKLRYSFDEFFPFAANLNRLTRQPQFVIANFTTLYDSISAYYDKTKIHIDELTTYIQNFNDIVF